EVTIPNGNGQLRPGMIGTVAVGRTDAAMPTEVVTVPLTAVVKSNAADGSYAVLVVEKQGGADVARLRRVVLGDVRGNGVVVLQGVSVGDRIIVSGASLIVDGEPVRIVSQGV